MLSQKIQNFEDSTLMERNKLVCGLVRKEGK